MPKVMKRTRNRKLRDHISSRLTTALLLPIAQNLDAMVAFRPLSTLNRLVLTFIGHSSKKHAGFMFSSMKKVT